MILNTALKPLLTIFETLICFYALLKHKLRQTCLRHLPEPIQIFVYTFAASIYIPIIFVVFAIFGIYKCLVKFILLLRFRSKYAEMLNACDNLFITDVKSRGVINMFLKTTDENGEEFYLKLMNWIVSKMEEKKVPHLRYTLHRFMGYGYYLQEEFNIDEVVKKLPVIEGVETITDRQLHEIINSLANSNMPKNNTGLWVMYAGTQPIDSPENNEKLKVFPIFIRVGHSLGDGISLYQLLEYLLTIDEKTALIKMSGGKRPRRPLKIITDTKKLPLEDIIDNNVLFTGSENVTDQHCVYSNFEQTPLYVDKVKGIKNRIKGASFNNILFTAVSASLAEFFRKHSDNVPEFINISLPIQMSMKRLTAPPTDEIKLMNKFTIGLVEMPICPKSEGEIKPISLLERMNLVKTQMDYLAKTLDLKIIYLLLHLFPKFIPVKLMLAATAKVEQTMSISNVPGGGQRILFHGNKIKDMIFFIPKRDVIGIGISILTYENRFQLGLITDKNLNVNQDEVQKIIDNIFKYIDLLDAETKDGDSRTRF